MCLADGKQHLDADLCKADIMYSPSGSSVGTATSTATSASTTTSTLTTTARTLSVEASMTPSASVLLHVQQQSSSSSSSSSSPSFFHSFRNAVGASLLGLIAGFITIVFSLFLPYQVFPTAAKAVYQPAFYQYDPSLSHFDNTIYTYGTDYALMIIMFVLAYMQFNSNSSNNSSNNRYRQSHQHNHHHRYHRGLAMAAAGLMSLYAISVAAGGLAHQFFLDLDSRNHWTFQYLWTLCVGTVTAAGGAMGVSASQVARAYAKDNNNSSRRRRQEPSSSSCKYIISEWFWIAFGTFNTIVCAMGYMSFQRPACDIFVAGITQFPSTVYICVLALTAVPSSATAEAATSLTNSSTTTSSTTSTYTTTTTVNATTPTTTVSPVTTTTENSNITPRTTTTTATTTATIGAVSNVWRFLTLLGFSFNAPLLPMYAFLLYHTNWSLAQVNTLLHSWLCVSWTLQGLALRQLGQCAASTTTTTTTTMTREDGPSPTVALAVVDANEKKVV